ncbi:MAG: UvrD-helicase domain-containing protein [Kiritimatiellia bacterium]
MLEFSHKIADPAFELDAATLVEASAGTGKTYNIQNVYLRLILQKALPVEKVLVVTFTEAATLELRDRLRKILTLTRDVLEGSITVSANDRERVDVLLTASAIAVTDGRQKARALNRVRLAIMDFDHAAIFTIHGFCNRALQRYAFECGHDPLAALVADESEIIASVCRNWWRQHTYGNESNGAVPFATLQQLAGCLGEYRKKPDAVLQPLDSSDRTDELLTARAQSIVQQIDRDQDLFVDAAQVLELSPADVDWEALTLTVRVPAAVVRLQDAARAIAVPKLQGAFAWQDGLIVGPGSAAYDVRALRNLPAQACDAIRDWSARAQPYLPSTKKVKAFLAACMAVCGSASETDAKEYLRAVGLVARDDIAALCKPCRICKVIPAVGELVADMQMFRLSRQRAVIGALAAAVQQEIHDRSVMTYNDMLRNVMIALHDVERGARLQDVLREEFQAALIDEFQDTDPVQYNIFRTLFMGTGIPLVFVGDPKQAIYGFRGGDVFTYYVAKDGILAQGEDRLFSLGTNYRSEARLVGAVNALFADRAGDATFRHAAIPYAGDLQAHDMKPEDLLVLPDGNTQPLQVWRYGSGKKPGQTHKLVKAMYADVTGEIVGMLQNGSYRIGARPVRAGDIAVLVHTHGEAAEICAALHGAGVHAVQQNSGNVFDTQEARALGLILKAVLNASDTYAVRGALVGNLLPCATAQLMAFCQEDTEVLQDVATLADAAGQPTDVVIARTDPIADVIASPETLDAWMALFREAGDCWRQRSFILAFSLLMRKTGMRAHIVQQADGERKLTNLLHLIELLHATAETLRNRPAGLVQWFDKQLDAAGRDSSDEHLMRMASDEDAVKIMTIHKSKGLQFPVVFVPTLWRKKAEARASNGLLFYHNDGNELIATLDTNDPVAKALATEEHFQEDIRLLYVALTRAKNRVYVVQWGEWEPDNCAIDRLLVRVADACPDTIAFVDAAVSKGLPSEGGAMPGATGRQLVPPGLPRVNLAHGHTSFSGLEPGVQELVPGAERDLDASAESATRAMAVPAIGQADIFSIPGGKQTGNCWHDIFEQIDFQGDRQGIRATVDVLLDQYRICAGPTEAVEQARCEAVHEMVFHTLAAPLQIPGTETIFCLHDIAFAVRRSELAFHFALRQEPPTVKTAAIRDVLLRHWGADPHRQACCDALHTNWEKELPLGYLTGYMDLVFCHADRFYIVDWKSNRRSGVLADFGRDGLAHEMARNFYFLQYLLYMVALDGYLSKRLKGYSYDVHIGGVYYVFLRGIGHHETRGIYTDLPTKELIRELSALLTGGCA